ncbi:MAG: hypothetical protein HC817_07590 [Saprospiraceae bacterium]|nr:hypothetical protein [Saprospiraceae bacterium]
MLHRINGAIKFFVHPKFKETIIRHRRATILISTHFYLIVSIILLFLLSKSLEKVALMPIFVGVPLLVCSLFYFKKRGNIDLSGNILTVIWYCILIPILLKTGGINSSFIPWLYSIILIMVLVENYFWATSWFIIASISCFALFYAGRIYPNLSASVCTDTDTLISYLTVGFFMFTNLAIFGQHQIFVVKILKEKNELLNKQKANIAENITKLELLHDKLKESNQELQVFAYAASHDLKEPLRMITMYTQLLERRFEGLLDENTNEFMFYITDGSKRMQKLLDNLLAYSLLGKNEEQIELIDLNKKIANVKRNLLVLIAESDAEIRVENLPSVLASKTEMAQLFQNLIANALKFRKKDIPTIINITCQEAEKEYQISIQDNGIGIKPEDQKRIFDIFTRLHSNQQYEGTGIGLATCKKILSNMNCKIWVESTVNVGTTFHFTLPKPELKNNKETQKKLSESFLE